MENIHPIFSKILSRKEKQQFLNQKSIVIWMTGLSGSGKSTIAEGLEKKLFDHGYRHAVLIVDETRVILFPFLRLIR